MEHLNLILAALIAEPPVKTRPKIHDDIVDLKHRLRSTIEQRLEGNLASRDMLDRYDEQPNVFGSVLADALVNADIHQDAKVIELATELMQLVEPLNPTPPIETEVFEESQDEAQHDPPSTIPGVLPDEFEGDAG